MHGADILMVIASMFLSFILGGVGVLLIGGRTSLHYLMVKMGRGKKVLVFARTRFGWRSYVGKKDEDRVIWKYDKTRVHTIVKRSDVGRYMSLEAVFIDTDKPTVALSVGEGSFYPADFDPQVFNNLLERAFTRPDAEGVEVLKKMLIGLLFLVALIGLGVLLIYTKVQELGAGGVI